ncbi:unnamed protein product, partial [Ectocarpus sp. 12 AP-2014]
STTNSSRLPARAFRLRPFRRAAITRPSAVVAPLVVARCRVCRHSSSSSNNSSRSLFRHGQAEEEGGRHRPCPRPRLGMEEACRRDSCSRWLCPRSGTSSGKVSSSSSSSTSSKRGRSEWVRRRTSETDSSSRPCLRTTRMRILWRRHSDSDSRGRRCYPPISSSTNSSSTAESTSSGPAPPLKASRSTATEHDVASSSRNTGIHRRAVSAATVREGSGNRSTSSSLRRLRNGKSRSKEQRSMACQRRPIGREGPDRSSSIMSRAAERKLSGCCSSTSTSSSGVGRRTTRTILLTSSGRVRQSAGKMMTIENGRNKER